MQEKLFFFAFLDIGQGCQSEELTKQGEKAKITGEPLL
jgi:hypothetical protein